MTTLNWKVSKEDHDLIMAIARRAVKLTGEPHLMQDVLMDVTVVHANGNPLLFNDPFGTSSLSFLGACGQILDMPAAAFAGLAFASCLEGGIDQNAIVAEYGAIVGAIWLDELNNLYNDPDKNIKEGAFLLDVQLPGKDDYRFALAVAGKKPVLKAGPNAVTGRPFLQ